MWYKFLICFNIFILSFTGYTQVPISKELKEDLLKICSVCKKDSTQFFSYNKNRFHLGHYYYRENKLDLAFAQISTLLGKERIKEDEAYILHYLKGDILNKKGLPNKALESYKTALLIGDQYSSTSRIYHKLSNIYLLKENYKEVVSLLEEWKNEMVSMNYTRYTSISIHNLGIAYLHLKDYQKAEENLLKSHQMNEVIHDTNGLAYSCLDLANLYYTQYKDHLALVYFKQGLAYAKKGDDLYVLQNAYLNMSVFEENRKAYKASLEYRKMYENIKDSIWNRDKIWDLAEKDKEIARKINAEKIQAEQEQNTRMFWFLNVLVVVLLLLSFLSYKISKQKEFITKQKDKLEQLNAFKNNLFAVIGHDLRSPMHHILNVNKQMQKAVFKDELSLLSKLIDRSSLAANKMYLLLDNLLHWMLLQNNQLTFEKDLLNVRDIANQVIFNFTALLKQKDIEVIVSIPEELFMCADFNSIKVVLRNVIDNAIKFTPKGGSIKIYGEQQDKNTILEIVDDGIGFKSNTITLKSNKESFVHNGTGFGLKICKSFTELNGGAFKIKGKADKGTKVIISLNSK